MLRNISMVTSKNNRQRCALLKLLCLRLCHRQHSSISLPSIIHCEKCSHFRELSGNLYFDTVTQQLSPRDRKRSLLCWRRVRGLQEEVSRRTEARGLSSELSLSSPPRCRSQIQQRGEGWGGGLPLRGQDGPHLD